MLDMPTIISPEQVNKASPLAITKHPAEKLGPGQHPSFPRRTLWIMDTW